MFFFEKCIHISKSPSVKHPAFQHPPQSNRKSCSTHLLLALRRRFAFSPFILICVQQAHGSTPNSAFQHDYLHKRKIPYVLWAGCHNISLSMSYISPQFQISLLLLSRNWFGLKKKKSQNWNSSHLILGMHKVVFSVCQSDLFNLEFKTISIFFFLLLQDQFKLHVFRQIPQTAVITYLDSKLWVKVWWMSAQPSFMEMEWSCAK